MATPFGIIAEPLQNFKVMLSKCPAFQLWCEETEPAIPDAEPTRSEACLDYIHLIKYAKPASGGFVYPVVIVDLPEDLNYETVGVSANGMDFSNGRGVFDVTLMRVVPTAQRSDDVEAWINFVGWTDDNGEYGLGQIIEELKSLSMVGTYLWINDIALQEGPWWISEEKKNPANPIIGAKLRITWGFG